MKYPAMAMMAVLAMASVSMAVYTVELPGGVSADVTTTLLPFGKVGYGIHINGAKTFEAISVVGVIEGQCTEDTAPVHQVFLGAPGGASETPYLGQLPGVLPPPEDPTFLDTHFLFAAVDVVMVPPPDAPPMETCSEANENGLTDDCLYYSGVASVLSAGMGTFDTRKEYGDVGHGYAFLFRGELDPAGYDLLYVVLEKGTGAAVTGLYVDPSLDIQTMCVPLDPVPEPGTIVMFLAGALCTVGIRFHK